MEGGGAGGSGPAIDAKAYFELFTQIYKSIPENVFDHSRDAHTAAIMIYLTAVGIRPACLPFDNPLWTSRALAHQGALDGLKGIAQIAVAVGPYYEFGQCIIILHRETIENTKAVLKDLEEYSLANGGTAGKYHNLPVSASRLFGYNVPLATNDAYNDCSLLEISFLIDGYYHMCAYLPKSDEHKLKAIEKFRAIHKVLQPLQRSVRLVINYIHFSKISGRTHGNI